MQGSDVIRELQKAENVLGMVERYLTAHNESMAALHLSERVIPSPLTSAVMQARTDLTQTVSRLASEETSSDGSGSMFDRFLKAQDEQLRAQIRGH